MKAEVAALVGLPATPTTDIGSPNRKAGEFAFFVTWENHGVAGMNYVCPCGCGTVGELRFAQEGKTPRAPTYIWDGNRERPTITPYIRHVVAGHVCWEGILQRGIWIGENDDTEKPGGIASPPEDPARGEGT